MYFFTGKRLSPHRPFGCFPTVSGGVFRKVVRSADMITSSDQISIWNETAFASKSRSFEGPFDGWRSCRLECRARSGTSQCGGWPNVLKFRYPTSSLLDSFEIVSGSVSKSKMCDLKVDCRTFMRKSCLTSWWTFVSRPTKTNHHPALGSERADRWNDAHFCRLN